MRVHQSETMSGRRNMALGLALSVAVHLGAGAALVSRGFEAGLRASSEADTVLDEAPPLRLGIDQSTVATINWVGFEAPTEHAAAPSTVEQAAVTPVEGLSEAASEDQPSPESAPRETPRTEVEPVEQTEPNRQPEAEPVAPQSRPAAGIPMDAFAPVPTAPVADPVLAVAPADTPTPAEETEDGEPTETRDERAESSPPTESGDASPAREAARPADPSGTPGIRDEREADASAISRTLEVRPGRPVAAEGLQINTVRPQYSVTVRAIARPRNPVVVIRFDRTGKVRRADWVVRGGKTLNTGSVHVDGPLMDAIYRWTAKGAALEALEQDRTLDVEIRLLINGS